MKRLFVFLMLTGFFSILFAPMFGEDNRGSPNVIEWQAGALVQDVDVTNIITLELRQEEVSFVYIGNTFAYLNEISKNQPTQWERAFALGQRDNSSGLATDQSHNRKMTKDLKEAWGLSGKCHQTMRT